MSGKITAIATAVLMVLLPLSLCCMPAPPHPCCKDRCAMAPDAAPVVAIPLMALVVSPAPATVGGETGFRRLDRTPGPIHPRFNPVQTIQLRI